MATTARKLAQGQQTEPLLADDYEAGVRAGIAAAYLIHGGAGDGPAADTKPAKDQPRPLLVLPVDVRCHLFDRVAFVVSDALSVPDAKKTLATLAYVASELMEAALTKIDDEEAERMVYKGASVVLSLVAALADGIARAAPPDVD